MGLLGAVIALLAVRVMLRDRRHGRGTLGAGAGPVPTAGAEAAAYAKAAQLGRGGFTRP